MRQLIFALTYTYMLCVAATATMLLTWLSPEKLAPTRMAWLSDPSGVLIGTAICGILATLPLVFVMATDKLSYNDGVADTWHKVNKEWFLVRKP